MSRSDDITRAEYYTRVSIAVESVKAKIKGPFPRVAIVLGSGLNTFVDHLTDTVKIPYTDIPYVPGTTVKGHSGTLVVGNLEMGRGPTRVLCWAGRVHAYEGWRPFEIGFIARFSYMMGVDLIVQTNSSGGALIGMVPGTIMIIRDHLRMAEVPILETDFFHSAVKRHGGPLEKKEGCVQNKERFTSTRCYSEQLADIAEECAEKLGVPCMRGVYCWTSGPTYETHAEVVAGVLMGGGAFGMSTVPEVVAGKSLGMEVFGLALCTNLAAGMDDEEISHEQVTQAAKKAGPAFQSLLLATLKKEDRFPSYEEQLREHNAVPSLQAGAEAKDNGKVVKRRKTTSSVTDRTRGRNLLDGGGGAFGSPGFYLPLQQRAYWTPTLFHVLHTFTRLHSANYSILATQQVVDAAIIPACYHVPAVLSLLTPGSVRALPLTSIKALRDCDQASQAAHTGRVYFGNLAGGKRVAVVALPLPDSDACGVGVRGERSLSPGGISCLLQALHLLGARWLISTAVGVPPPRVNDLHPQKQHTIDNQNAQGETKSGESQNKASPDTDTTGLYTVADVLDRSYSWAPYPAVLGARYERGTADDSSSLSVVDKQLPVGVFMQAGGSFLPSRAEGRVGQLALRNSKKSVMRGMGVSNLSVPRAVAAQLGWQVAMLGETQASGLPGEQNTDALLSWLSAAVGQAEASQAVGVEELARLGRSSVHCKFHSRSESLDETKHHMHQESVEGKALLACTSDQQAISTLMGRVPSATFCKSLLAFSCQCWLEDEQDILSVSQYFAPPPALNRQQEPVVGVAKACQFVFQQLAVLNDGFLDAVKEWLQRVESGKLDPHQHRFSQVLREGFNASMGGAVLLDPRLATKPVVCDNLLVDIPLTELYTIGDEYGENPNSASKENGHYPSMRRDGIGGGGWGERWRFAVGVCSQKTKLHFCIYSRGIGLSAAGPSGSDSQLARPSFADPMVCFAVRMLSCLGVQGLITVTKATLVEQQESKSNLGVAVVSDHVNLSGTNPLFGFNKGSVWGTRFPDMGGVYTEKLRQGIIDTLADSDEQKAKALTEPFIVASVNNCSVGPSDRALAGYLQCKAISTHLSPPVIVAGHQMTPQACIAVTDEDKGSVKSAFDAARVAMDQW